MENVLHKFERKESSRGVEVAPRDCQRVTNHQASYAVGVGKPGWLGRLGGTSGWGMGLLGGSGRGGTSGSGGRGCGSEGCGRGSLGVGFGSMWYLATSV